MATQTTIITDVAYRLQTHYNPKLHKAVEDNLVLATYGLREGYSIHGTTIRFYRPRPASAAQVHGAMTEGTVPTTLATVAVGYKDIVLYQRGQLSEKITDLLQALDLLPIVELYTRTFGEDAALDLDGVVRNALETGLTGSNATYTPHYFERCAGITNSAVSQDDFTNLNALSAANAKITRARHLANVTQLRAAKVPQIGNRYVAVIPPEIMHDLRQDTDWVAAATQVNNQALYKRGQIELDGCVFVEADNAYRETVYGTYAAAGANFTVWYLGRDAFGIPNLTDKRAGSDPFKPKISIVGLTPDSNNPLAQWIQIGWKTYYGCGPFITNATGEVPHYLQFRCKSTF